MIRKSDIPILIMKSSSNIVFSTIITTTARPTLARAVESVLSQNSPVNFEVIVVNDSGKSLPVETWHHSERVTILNTNRRERCVARNAGAAIAHGEYVHFLDDDDWMLPDAFKELWTVARGRNASLVYGATKWINKDGKLLAEHHIGVDGNAFVQLMAGELIPLLSSLFESKVFFEVGGFNPRFVWAEDWDIGRRVALRGDVVSTHHPVACAIKDDKNSTTNYKQGRDSNSVSIDLILDEKGSFARMLASAKNNYWRGKMVRTYLTGIAWNLGKGKFLKALSRASMAATSLILFAAHITSLIFWKSVYLRHDSQVNCG
jgi:glycosyltransferase involved in cell wall biosynthesis